LGLGWLIKDPTAFIEADGFDSNSGFFCELSDSAASHDGAFLDGKWRLRAVLGYGVKRKFTGESPELAPGGVPLVAGGGGGGRRPKGLRQRHIRAEPTPRQAYLW